MGKYLLGVRVSKAWNEAEDKIRLKILCRDLGAKLHWLNGFQGFGCGAPALSLHSYLHSLRACLTLLISSLCMWEGLATLLSLFAFPHFLQGHGWHSTPNMPHTNCANLLGNQHVISCQVSSELGLPSQLNKSFSHNLYVTPAIWPPPGSHSRLIREKCKWFPWSQLGGGGGEYIYIFLQPPPSSQIIPSLSQPVNAVILFKKWK